MVRFPDAEEMGLRPVRSGSGMVLELLGEYS
jgi:hypothetical protein